MQPELEARKRIDALLDKSGWFVQDRQNANPKAGAGVSVREFLFDSGEADYGLFVDGKAIGAIEAKKTPEDCATRSRSVFEPPLRTRLSLPRPTRDPLG